MTLADTPSPFEQAILNNIGRTGCHIMMVFDPDEEMPNFAYSVGFSQTVHQPEVIVFGLSNEIMGHMINETLRQCQGGLHLKDGCAMEGLLAGHLCVAREVAPENLIKEYFNSAQWYHQRQFGTEMRSAFQIVWPGAQDGLFPWDDGCSDIVRDRQLPLYIGDLNS